MKRKRKPWEFSKKLAVWAAGMATASVALSFLLAFLGRETAGEVSTTVFTSCVGYLITYAGKSLGEKISRNRHSLDEDGKPIVKEEFTNGEY